MNNNIRDKTHRETNDFFPSETALPKSRLKQHFLFDLKKEMSGKKAMKKFASFWLWQTQECLLYIYIWIERRCVYFVILRTT